MVFYGCFGAIDGLAVRIKSPTEVPDLVNYFCRRNFYALNIQAICDRKKRCLWISPHHQGASHDSFAWSESKLNDLLKELTDTLKENRHFLVGDSAYSMSAFFLAPDDNAQPCSPEDAYIFWHSNSRITIECSFGEMIMWCGLFWRPLQHSLKTSSTIIRAVAMLHNFLVDHRKNPNVLRMEEEFENTASTVSTGDDRMFAMPLVTDNNEPKPTRRKSTSYLQSQAEGKEWCDIICTLLLQEGNHGPKSNRMRYSSQGLIVYFE